MITLYKIDNTDSVREWGIEVKGAAYRTHYGQKDGQIVTTEWTLCESKNIGKANETSPEDQAQLEATAIVKKQREKGYSEQASKPVGNVMLAKNYEDYKNKIKFPVYAQPKLDGIRCYTTKDGMFTRNHKRIVGCPHIFESVKHLFDLFPNLKIDGELYNHSLKDDFNKICSLVKKAKPSKQDLEASKKIMEYWVYDIVDSTKTFKERLSFRNINLKDIDYVQLLRTDLVENQEELDNLYGEYLDAGNEGQIVRINEIYEEKRSKFLLKRKEFQDGEFTILQVVEGSGNRTGMAGHMEFHNEDGKWFKSNIKGTWEFLKECLDNKDKLIGKKATIKYFARTPDNIPRFPYVISIRDYE
jgi:DNA ligase-1